MNWDDLRYILALARSETLRGAAKTLQVSASTLSRRLQALEESAGAALFEKSEPGVVLTAAGEEMVSVAEAVEQLTADLERRIGGLDATLEGCLRVVCPELLIARWMPELAEFKRRHPGIQLELSAGESATEFPRHEIDVAVHVAPHAPERLLARSHAELFFAVYASPRLVAEIGEEAPYSAYPWLAGELGLARRTHDYLRAHLPEAPVVLRVDRLAPMLCALEAGLGLTILPCVCGDAQPELRRVGNYFEGGAQLWVSTQPEHHGFARVRAFTAFVRELIERDKGLLEGRRPQARRRA